MSSLIKEIRELVKEEFYKENHPAPDMSGPIEHIKQRLPDELRELADFIANIAGKDPEALHRVMVSAIFDVLKRHGV